ncbi:DUF1033 family protein [Streptococcus caprae]|uniref:DUF1033 family protein n=1 Tax=Streptococcus caprae TaxID=1640501 RepID=A0ABV8CW33_9STRE
MYQVIEMYGDFEPWWFLEGWEADLTQTESFDSYDQALLCYEQKWRKLKISKQCHNSRASLMAAFWNKEDKRWCEECDEHLTQYCSIALLYNGKEVAPDQFQERFERQNCDVKPPSSCSFKKSS